MVELALPKSRARAQRMTQAAYQALLDRLPIEHQGPVEEIVRGLKRALIRERSTRKVFEKHLRRTLTIREFDELQRIAQAESDGGGMPPDAKPGNSRVDRRDARS
jgi:hypothetical protein